MIKTKVEANNVEKIPWLQDLHQSQAKKGRVALSLGEQGHEETRSLTGGQQTGKEETVSVQNGVGLKKENARKENRILAGPALPNILEISHL